MTRGQLCVVAVAIVGAMFVGAARAQAPVAKSTDKLINADFTSGGLGEVPAGWSVPSPGFKALTVSDEQAASKRAAELRPDGKQGPEAWGNIMQAIDATPYRGKRVVLRAKARLVFPSPVTQDSLAEYATALWLRVDRAGEKQGFFDNMSDRPIQGSRARELQTYTISGFVDEDASVINIGLITFGGATARLADVQVLAADGLEKADRAPAPLGERGLANLTALAKLYGYVRFFHPSDQAAEVDWAQLPIAAVEIVEPAASAKELASALEKVFGPIAPTVQIWAGDGNGAPPAAGKPDDANRYRVWKHMGCGFTEGRMNVYSSRRESVAIESKQEGLPVAGTSVVKDLGAGVWCRVPVCVWADGLGHTLPVPLERAATVKVSRPEGWVPSGRDRSTRLGNVVNAWNVFQHFYPYFDVAKPDWGAVLARSLEAGATDADEAAFTRTMRRLVAELRDGHGNAYCSSVVGAPPPDMSLEWADDGNGGQALVVVKAGPECTLVKAGDVIVAINGRATDEVYREALAFISAATDQWARYRLANDREFIAPGMGETVSYTIRREGKELSVNVARAKRGTRLVREKHPENLTELAPGVVYFDLNGAEEKAFNAALPTLAKAKGIVFDARGYPGSAGAAMLGHLSDKEMQSAFWVVPLVTLPDQDPVGYKPTEFDRWQVTPLEPRLGANGQKIAFVTGGGAISYAESCMGIVEAYKLGEIVGGPTAGTNGNINPFALPGGFNLVWTGMQVLKHDHSRHHGVGIQPTVPARRTVAGIAAGRDEVLEAAVKKVSE